MALIEIPCADEARLGETCAVENDAVGGYQAELDAFHCKTSDDPAPVIVKFDDVEPDGNITFELLGLMVIVGPELPHMIDVKNPSEIPNVAGRVIVPVDEQICDTPL